MLTLCDKGLAVALILTQREKGLAVALILTL